MTILVFFSSLWRLKRSLYIVCVSAIVWCYVLCHKAEWRGRGEMTHLGERGFVKTLCLWISKCSTSFVVVVFLKTLTQRGVGHTTTADNHNCHLVSSLHNGTLTYDTVETQLGPSLRKRSQWNTPTKTVAQDPRDGAKDSARRPCQKYVAGDSDQLARELERV